VVEIIGMGFGQTRRSGEKYNAANDDPTKKRPVELPFAQQVPKS
jgi:hypothetical protein